MAKGQGIRGRGAGRPNAVDVHVGRRVRQRRTLMGFSQERLGEAIGLTFQQVQKYERGSNRISASRLYDLSQVLDTDMNFFFADMPEEVAARSPSRVLAEKLELEDYMPAPDPVIKRETLELVRAYYRISRPEMRKRLFEMTKALAALDGRKAEEDNEESK